MELTAADKQILSERYRGWGLDTVRDDLKRPFRHIFVSRERNEFAKHWVGETEVQEQRREVRGRRMVRFLMFAAIVELGVAVGLNIDLPL